jgi:hypothetical protein
MGADGDPPPDLRLHLVQLLPLLLTEHHRVHDACGGTADISSGLVHLLDMCSKEQHMLRTSVVLLGCWRAQRQL